MKNPVTKGAAFGLACFALCTSALADPREGGRGSCAGYEASSVSPPGSDRTAQPKCLRAERTPAYSP